MRILFVFERIHAKNQQPQRKTKNSGRLIQDTCNMWADVCVCLCACVCLYTQTTTQTHPTKRRPWRRRWVFSSSLEMDCVFFLLLLPNFQGLFSAADFVDVYPWVLCICMYIGISKAANLSRHTARPRRYEWWSRVWGPINIHKRILSTASTHQYSDPRDMFG